MDRFESVTICIDFHF